MRTKGAAETLAIVERLDRLVKAVGRSVEYMITMLDEEYYRAAEEMKQRCANECKPDLHFTRIRDRILAIPTRGKND